MNGFNTKPIPFYYIIKVKDVIYPFIVLPTLVLNECFKIFVTSKCHFSTKIGHIIIIYSKSTIDTRFKVPKFENMECFTIGNILTRMKIGYLNP